MLNKLSLACVALFISSNVHAQCRSGFIHPGIPVSSYVPPVVIHKEVVAIKEIPVAVPVIVPAFTFQYSPPCYAPPAAAAPAATPTHPVGHSVPGGSIPVGAADPGSKDKIRELAKALLEEMSRQSDPGGDGPPVASGPLVGSHPVVPGGGLPGGGSQITKDQAAPFAIAALQRNCAACHTGNASKGDFVLFSQPGVFNPQASFRSAMREIEAGRMPPRSSQYRLTQEEANYARIWLGGL